LPQLSLIQGAKVHLLAEKARCLDLDLVFLRHSLLLLVIARDVLGDEDVDDLQREHRAELLLGHARLDELALRHRSVVVLVHLMER